MPYVGVMDIDAATSPTVLFVCVRNGGKSQMAAALARSVAGDRLDVHSAGTDPGTTLNQESAASVEEVGASMDGEFPKPIDPEVIGRARRVVLIGAEAELDPAVPVGGEVVRWQTDEPSERGIEGMERMRIIRDEINQRVRSLVDDLAPAD